MNFKFSLSLIIATFLLMLSCSTPRKTGFDLQKEVWENDFIDKQKPDSSQRKIFLTGTKPIDSIDVNKVIVDIYRVEPKDYPNEVRLFSRVYDSLGNFVTNMADPYKKDISQKYFTRINENLGKNYNIRAAEVDSFKVREYGAKDSIAYNISLDVDYSGSMDAVLDAIDTGIELFVSMKFDYDKIAFATFNKDYDLKVPLTRDSTEILNLYRKNKKRNFGLFSAVYDAVWKSIEILKDQPKEEPKVLVIFTDGDDNYSKKTIDTLIKAAVNNDIHVFCVAFGYSKDDNLKNLADYTGGRFYRAYTKEQLVAIFRDIYLSLRYYYLISYKPPKYWGYHKVFSSLNLPGRSDTLVAEGNYDTSGWLSLSDTIMKPILFDFARAEIKPESMYIIDELVDLMFTWPKLRFDIHGHTDNISSAEINQALSESRAKAVYDALVSKGVEPMRLRYRGFGFTRPVAPNDNEENRAKNRRTEFLIIAK